MSLSDCPKCWNTPCTCGYEYRGYALDKRLELAEAVMGSAFKEEFATFKAACLKKAAQVCPVTQDPNAPLEAYQKRLDADAAFFEKAAVGLVQSVDFRGASPFATGGAVPTMDEQERMIE